MSNKNRILCDYQCPKHKECANYLESFDKTKTLHYGKSPYNYEKNKCSGFLQLTEDDLIDIITNIIKPV